MSSSVVAFVVLVADVTVVNVFFVASVIHIALTMTMVFISILTPIIAIIRIISPFRISQPSASVTEASTRLLLTTIKTLFFSLGIVLPCLTAGKLVEMFVSMSNCCQQQCAQETPDRFTLLLLKPVLNRGEVGEGRSGHAMRKNLCHRYYCEQQNNTQRYPGSLHHSSFSAQ